MISEKKYYDFLYENFLVKNKEELTKNMGFFHKSGD